MRERRRDSKRQCAVQSRRSCERIKQRLRDWRERCEVWLQRRSGRRTTLNESCAMRTNMRPHAGTLRTTQCNGSGMRRISHTTGCWGMVIKTTIWGQEGRMERNKSAPNAKPRANPREAPKAKPRGHDVSCPYNWTAYNEVRAAMKRVFLSGPPKSNWEGRSGTPMEPMSLPAGL